MKWRLKAFVGLVLLSTSIGLPAAAQDAEAAGGNTNASSQAVDSEKPWAAPAAPDTTQPATPLGDEQAVLEESASKDAEADDSSPKEDPKKKYFFLGAFYRHIFMPGFLLNLFFDDSTATNNPSFGAEFTYRANGFDIVGNLWWARAHTNGPYRANGDPQTQVEIINSNLSVMFATASFLWSTEFNDVFSLQYGVDVGLGFVFGSLTRTEAYPDSGPGSVNGFNACKGVGTPDATYCDGPPVGDGQQGGQYGVKARRWTDGGSVPNFVPWIAFPHLALRIKPVKQLMMRIEAGFGIGIFTGFSAAYGF